MVSARGNVESEVTSLAPMHFRGYCLLAGLPAPVVSLALATHGVASIYWKTPSTALAFGMSVLLAGATAFV